MYHYIQRTFYVERLAPFQLLVVRRLHAIFLELWAGGTLESLHPQNTPPYARRTRSFCRLPDRMSGSSYTLPDPMPTFPVEALPSDEKGPSPCVCPLCHGSLTGDYLTQMEALAEQWELMLRPRRSKPNMDQLRRMPYKLRRAPRN